MDLEPSANQKNRETYFHTLKNHRADFDRLDGFSLTGNAIIKNDFEKKEELSGVEQWTLKSLEYDQVKEMVKSEAATVLGKEKVSQLTPSGQRDQVKHRLQATQEGMDLIRLKGDLPLGGVRDIRAAVRRAEKSGVLTESECLDIAGTISAGRKVKSFLRQVEDEEAPLPILRGLTELVESLEWVEEEILKSIDEQGVVKDQASPGLGKIRSRIGEAKKQIQQTLQEILRNPHYTKMMQEAIITQRFDRYVIPVKQEYRSRFPGIVHDQSSSGATLFIEPEAVVSWNNRLRQLELQEKQEVEKVLKKLTEKIAPEVESLKRNLEILASLDCIMACARFGYRVKGICPEISESLLHLKKARHPLIKGEDVVPIEVSIGDDYHAIIITGPNTGGKTVTLKTVGLFALMTQSGIPVPAEEDSIMPVFGGVYADIGDEQSIEQNLSTFSGHLTKIIRILKQVDEKSLVLFDELGAGTDPTEGAALAISILEYVIQKGSFVMATTHYSELKLFAHHHPKTVNASMEFDVETLKPTYRLLIGVPGRSNAFNISRRLGLPEEIIERAKAHLSSDEKSLEEMISSLTTEQKLAREKHKEADALQKEAEALYADIREKWEQFEEEKAALKEKARREAQRIIADAEREAEEVLKQLRAWAKARPGDLKEHELNEAKARLKNAVPDWELPQKPRKNTGKAEKLNVGDEVRVLSVNQNGTITEDMGDGYYQVQVGFLKMKMHRDQLEKRSSPKPADVKIKPTVNRMSANVKPECDLRGKLVEEALLEIDNYLDKALLAGYKEIHLIHGKGTGALRQGVQKFLRSHRHVKSFRLGNHNEGGSGVTVVELK
jgi:DNA mismatch repair protein MutS2